MAQTIAEIEEELALLREAKKKILTSAQSFSIGDTTYNRAKLSDIIREIQRLEVLLSFRKSQVVSGGKKRTIGYQYDV